MTRPVSLLASLLAASTCLLATPPEPASSLVEPAQLAQWIKAGYRTGSGRRVVILDALPSPAELKAWYTGDPAALKVLMGRQYGPDSAQVRMISALDQKGLLGHVPGAQANTSHTGLEVMDRDEGPGSMEHEVGTGPAIEALLGQQGITLEDVVVIASAQQVPPALCGPRLWWTLTYWGFPADRLKLLDGGDKAWAMAGLPMERGPQKAEVKVSTFRLPPPPERRLDARVSLQEMIDLVDSGKTTNGSMVLLDVRQPPVAFFLKDVRRADGTAGADGTPDLFQVSGFQFYPEDRTFTREGQSARFSIGEMLFSPATVAPGAPVRAAFNPVALPPVPEDNSFLAHGHLRAASGQEVPLAVPLSQKPTDFEGIIRGAHLVKTGAYDITLPSLLGPDNRFKSREELLALFAKAGIAGTKPVVLYCNTGALSAVYVYALQEICGFKQIRMYDGSWQEWGSLAAFEPADGTFVRHDPVLTLPKAPAPMPAFWIFTAENHPLEWDGHRFTSPGFSPVDVQKHLRPREPMNGQLRWDTLHRSEHVVFRPTEAVNDPGHFQTYHAETDWPLVDLHPGFQGRADRIRQEDEAYRK